MWGSGGRVRHSVYESLPDPLLYQHEGGQFERDDGQCHGALFSSFSIAAGGFCRDFRANYILIATCIRGLEFCDPLTQPSDFL